MTHLKTPGFRQLPQTGVIYVMQRAMDKGWSMNDPAWSNLGQGAPEVGLLSDIARINEIHIPNDRHEYSPVAGQKDLRQKVADLYNTRYRKNKTSQYTWENVAICGGGRMALTRIAASLGNINMGHFIPDYTAYEELLGIFKAFVPIPIIQDYSCGYQLSTSHIESEIIGRGLSALLLSNPCNPTGQLIEKEELKDFVSLARKHSCSIIFDEFYSHYIYSDFNENNPRMVSAAEYVNNVDNDPIIIIDGLTKNWRYPGWRISWIVAPKDVINVTNSAGSFLDGGASNILQNQVMNLLNIDHVILEAKALQKSFIEKRDYAVSRLQSMNIKVEKIPQGTFYIWADISNLNKSISDGHKFLEACLLEKVITVPGIFFDVNPEKRRSNARFNHHVRISFGPSMSELKKGLDAIQRVIDKC